MANRKRMSAALRGGTPVQRRAGEGTAAADGTTVVEGTVRATVDLAESRHRALKVWAAQEGATLSDVVRALIDELLTDEDLADRIRLHIQ